MILHRVNRADVKYAISELRSPGARYLRVMPDDNTMAYFLGDALVAESLLPRAVVNGRPHVPYVCVGNLLLAVVVGGGNWALQCNLMFQIAS